MRPQQQNRRMRGRNNNNNNNNNNRRGGPNPLTRSYESNGPDVKIRGNAQQIAEKYTTLARDAMSSGDRVMAENYLQHAEHYNRIIAAAQAQMPIQNFQQNRDDLDDEDMEDGEFERQPNSLEGNAQQAAPNGSGPQPVIEGMPAEVALNTETGGNRESNGREDRRDGFRNRDRRGQNGHRNGDYPRREQQADGEQPDVAASSDEAAGDGLPDFLTGAPQAAEAPASKAPGEEAPAKETAPRRSRRPRRGERPGEEAAQEPGAPVAAQPAADTPLVGSDE